MLFSVMPVTRPEVPAPMAALINVVPVPVPLLVMVPALLTAVVEIVMPLVTVLLLFGFGGLFAVRKWSQKSKV